MADVWTDERLDAALDALGRELDVPGAGTLPPFTAGTDAVRRWPRVLAVVAIAAAIVAVLVVAVPPARDTVARWFGVRIEQDGAATADGTFVDDAVALDVDTALRRADLEHGALDATALGRPEAAAVPPEGGVLFAWDDGATTLWVRPGDDDVMVVKRVGPEGSELVGGLGDYAVLLDGTHVLDTPSRRVAAGRVLWWLDGGRQWRLESDLDAPALLDIARDIAAAT